MRFGMHLRELSRLRIGVALSLLLATFVALSVGFKVQLLPPSLHAKSLDIGSASTQVLVDTPTTIVLDLKQASSDFTAQTDRAVLIGNVMASLPVREFIARRAHIPAGLIKATTPLTAAQPRPVSGPESQKHTSDIFRSPHEYRINIQVNPTVPVLTVYAQAPSGTDAEALANAAVDGTRDYLAAQARADAVGLDRQLRLTQLGRATGGVIDKGARVEAMVIAFLLTLAFSSAAVLFVARVRRGWDAVPAGDATAVEAT